MIISVNDFDINRLIKTILVTQQQMGVTPDFNMAFDLVNDIRVIMMDGGPSEIDITTFVDAIEDFLLDIDKELGKFYIKKRVVYSYVKALQEL